MSEQRLADIFDSASPDFDSLTPRVWGPVGRALVDAAGLRPGQRVLDICSGTGASAIAAARAVGESGSVVAVDFAAGLIDRARVNAEAENLRNIDFRVADVTTVPDVEQSAYDALTCGFGVFFLPDMDASVRRLITVLRPGGRLSFAVWFEAAMRDFTSAFFAEVARANGADTAGPRGPSGDMPHPITRIDTVDKITAWLESVGAVDATASVLRLRIPRTDDFSWSMILGSGMRGSLSGLDEQAVARLRTNFLHRLAAEGVTEIDCDTLIATARRPQS